MKTSISSEAITQFGAEKIGFPPKPDIRTDISNYRVASLPKIYVIIGKIRCEWYLMIIFSTKGKY